MSSDFFGGANCLSNREAGQCTSAVSGAAGVFADEMAVLTFRGVEPLKKYRKSGLEHFIKFVKDLPSVSPKTIFERLDEFGYRGQREARRAVALMAYRHVLRIKRIHL